MRPAAFESGQFGDFQNDLRLRTRVFQSAIAVITNRQGEVLENRLMAEQSPATLEHHPDAQALGELLAFVHLVKIAPEHQMRSGGWSLQARSGREQIGLS